MVEDRLHRAVEQGDALRFEAPLRTGGRIGITDECVLILRDSETEDVPLENVKEVTIQSIDWFLVVLSVALAGVGFYGVVGVGDLLLGGAFVAAAAVNLYVTYRKRERVQLRLHTRGKPVTVYVEDIDDVRDALKRALDAYRAERSD